MLWYYTQFIEFFRISDCMLTFIGNPQLDTPRYRVTGDVYIFVK